MNSIKFLVSDCPYSQFNGEFIPFERGYIHSSETDFVMNYDEKDKVWHLANKQSVYCRATSSAPDPTQISWEYWKSSAGMYVITKKMKIEALPLLADDIRKITIIEEKKTAQSNHLNASIARMLERSKVQAQSQLVPNPQDSTLASTDALHPTNAALEKRQKELTDETMIDQPNVKTEKSAPPASANDEIGNVTSVAAKIAALNNRLSANGNIRNPRQSETKAPSPPVPNSPDPTLASDVLRSAKAASEKHQRELTEEDRCALDSFLASYTPAVGTALKHAERFHEIAGKVAAHDRALHVLVNKQKECPSLFWFYPKKRELRNWLSDPLKCLLQDSLMMVVVCPVTLRVVKCGPDGVGWEIRSPKKWVKEWGPAILASIYVMQAAVIAGRIVGVPLPSLPSVGVMTKLMGLQPNALKDSLHFVTEQVNTERLMKSFEGFAAATESCLQEQQHAMRALIDKMQQQQEQQRRQRAQVNSGTTVTAPPDEIVLGADMPTAMIDASYHSIHTFLTTGDNALLGKLEDQLRGSMERVMAEDGEVEWVSVQGIEAWKQKHAVAKSSVHHQPPPKPPKPPKPTKPLTSFASSWLAVRLRAKGVREEYIVHCEQKLVVEEDYSEEHLLGAVSSAHFTVEYLREIGITAGGLQQKLILIHGELVREQQADTPESSSPLSPESTASFTTDEKEALQKELTALKKEFNEIKSKAGNGGSPVPNQQSGSSSAGGGLKLKQRNEASAINPQTGQEYSMDELIFEMSTMKSAIASALQDVAHLGSAVHSHETDLEDLKGSSSRKDAGFASTPQWEKEHSDKKKDLFRSY